MLLENAGIRAKVHAPKVDEAPVRGETPRAMVRRLARLKAQTAMQDLVGSKSPDAPVMVISADTTVVTPDGKRALGKPETPMEAVKMLKDTKAYQKALSPKAEPKPVAPVKAPEKPTPTKKK